MYDISLATRRDCIYPCGPCYLFRAEITIAGNANFTRPEKKKPNKKQYGSRAGVRNISSRGLTRTDTSARGTGQSHANFRGRRYITALVVVVLAVLPAAEKNNTTRP